MEAPMEPQAEELQEVVSAMRWWWIGGGRTLCVLCHAGQRGGPRPRGAPCPRCSPPTHLPTQRIGRRLFVGNLAWRTSWQDLKVRAYAV